MYVYVEPYKIIEVKNVAALVAAEQLVTIQSGKFLISNTGAQPAYFKEKSIDGVSATSTNSMLIPANSVFPIALTGIELSVISNATGTTLAILMLDQ